MARKKDDGNLNAVSADVTTEHGTEPAIIDAVGEGAINPAELGTGTAKDNPPTGTGKKRGRPKKQQAQQATNLAPVLLSLHAMMARFTGVQELSLDEPEAAKLAEAVKRVEEYYGADWLPEEAAIWINLAGVCGMIYGPRFIAYRIRKAREARPPVAINRSVTEVHAEGETLPN